MGERWHRDASNCQTPKWAGAGAALTVPPCANLCGGCAERADRGGARDSALFCHPRLKLRATLTSIWPWDAFLNPCTTHLWLPFCLLNIP